MAKLVVKRSRNGRGIFSEESIKKGSTITVFTYPIFYAKSSKRNGTWLQVGDSLYMEPLGFIRFLNHSCSPNSGFKIRGKEARLVAIKDISAGDEVTFDYSTTMHKDKWSLKCNCGNRKCRGLITNFDTLTKSLQNRYKKLGIVPRYAYS